MSFAQRLTDILNASATATALGVASRTGLLSAVGSEPLTAEQLARTAGLSPRYVEEILAALVCGGVIELATGLTPRTYSLPDESKIALDSMGLYFEELPLLSQCAFDQVCRSAATGEGVEPSNYAAFGSWMGKLADEKHERQLVKHFLPALNGCSVVTKLAEGARVMDLGCGR